MLVGLHVNQRFFRLEIKIHRGYLGGLERIHDQHLDRLVPANDVDLLPEKLVDDVFNAGSSDTDAGADTIHVVIVGRDRDLGPIARLPYDLHDLDHLLGDFGDLDCEEGLDQKGACP